MESLSALHDLDGGAFFISILWCRWAAHPYLFSTTLMCGYYVCITSSVQHLRVSKTTVGSCVHRGGAYLILATMFTCPKVFTHIRPVHFWWYSPSSECWAEVHLPCCRCLWNNIDCKKKKCSNENIFASKAPTVTPETFSKSSPQKTCSYLSFWILTWRLNKLYFCVHHSNFL